MARCGAWYSAWAALAPPAQAPTAAKPKPHVIFLDLGLQGSNPHGHCYFLYNFRCGVPNDVDSLCFGWEGGAESAVASLPVCSWCPPACCMPARQPACFLAGSRSNPSWKPKWPSTVHKRMLPARSFAPVIPVSLGFSSAPGSPGALPTGMRMGLCLRKVSVPLPLPIWPQDIVPCQDMRMLCFPPTSLLKRLQEPGQGGMEGASLVGPLPGSHSPGDRLVPGAGGEGAGNGDAATRADRGSPMGLLPAGKGLCAGAPLYFTAFGPLGQAQQGA